MAKVAIKLEKESGNDPNKKVRINVEDNSNNVNNDSALLVNGSLQITGLKIRGSSGNEYNYGSSGQVPVTDGIGNIRWSSVSIPTGYIDDLSQREPVIFYCGTASEVVEAVI